MSTDTEQVEVTPELLASVEAICAKVRKWSLREISLPVGDAEALVRRIRGLETGMRAAIAEHDAQAKLWAERDDRIGEGNAGYHRMRGSLLRGYFT